jgi:hypothetical protein
MNRLISRRGLVLTVILLMVGCQPQPSHPVPRALDPELARLLVDSPLFPATWYLATAPFPWYWLEGAEASAAVQFRLQGSRARAIHTLFRYRNIAQAAAEYRRQMPGEFFSAERLTPWEAPEGLLYQSPVADQFRFGCAIIGRSYTDPDRFITCQVMGQYGKFLSIFFAWMSPEGMTPEDLERILKAIDERMAGDAGNKR